MMYVYKCNDCLQLQRWEWDREVNGALPKFCASCGSTDITFPEKVDSYWYDLSDSLGFGRSAEGAELTQGLYRIWDATKHSKFRDFVEETMKEYA